MTRALACAALHIRGLALRHHVRQVAAVRALRQGVPAAVCRRACHDHLLMVSR